MRPLACYSRELLLHASPLPSLVTPENENANWIARSYRLTLTDIAVAGRHTPPLTTPLLLLRMHDIYPRIFPPLDICPFPVPDPNPYCKPYPSLKPDNPNLNTNIVVNNPLNKSVSSFLRQRTTWHCPHSPAICTGERESKLLARSYRLTLTSRKTLLSGRYMPPPTPLSLLLLRM